MFPIASESERVWCLGDGEQDYKKKLPWSNRSFAGPVSVTLGGLWRGNDVWRDPC